MVGVFVKSAKAFRVEHQHFNWVAIWRNTVDRLTPDPNSLNSKVIKNPAINKWSVNGSARKRANDKIFERSPIHSAKDATYLCASVDSRADIKALGLIQKHPVQ